MPSNRELLRTFISFLAKKNAAFRGIPDEAIVSTWKGLGTIYDILRKKVPSYVDEKTPTSESRKGKAKSSESKEPTPQKASHKSKTQPVQADAVTITASGHHQGLEEKEVQFRKDMHSDREESESSMPDPSVTASDHSTARKSLLGKRQFQKIKKQFIDLLDAYEEEDLAGIVFDVHIKTKGAHIVHREDLSANLI